MALPSPSSLRRERRCHCATVDEPKAKTDPAPAGSARPPTPQQSARAQAALELDQQPPEVRRRYYEGRSKMAAAQVETLKQAIREVERARASMEPEKQATLDERIRDLRTRLTRMRNDGARYSAEIAKLGGAP